MRCSLDVAVSAVVFLPSRVEGIDLDFCKLIAGATRSKRGTALVLPIEGQSACKAEPSVGTGHVLGYDFGVYYFLLDLLVARASQ